MQFLNLSANKLQKVLWISLALTFSLFGVSFFRVNAGIIHIAIPMIILCFITGIGICNILISDGKLPIQLHSRKYDLIITLCALFFLWHLISIFQSTNLSLATKEMAKLFFGLICFWTIIFLFPKEDRFFETFIVVILISTSLLLVRLIYQYAFVFKVPWLGINLEEANRFGRNQLSFYLVIIAPYALLYYWKTSYKIRTSFIVAIIYFALIYCGSRSSWIAAAASLMYIMFFMVRVSVIGAIKMAGTIIFGGLIFMVAGLRVMSNYINLSEISIRLISIFYPKAIPENLWYLGKYSYAVRGKTLLQTIEAFYTSPILGVGLGNTTNYVNRITHNDYLAILLELGCIGEFLFLSLLLAIWAQGRFTRCNRYIEINWLCVASRASFVSLVVSLVFINTYTSLHCWIFMAFSLTALEIAMANKNCIDTLH
jgi:O-antigen ligase